MKVHIDREKCIGCGLCAGICTDVFKMNSEGIAEVKNDADFKKNEKGIREAAESCPVEAIEVEED